MISKSKYSEKMIQIKVVEVMKDYLLVTLNLTLNLTLRVIWRSTLNFINIKWKLFFMVLELKEAGNFTFRYVMSVVKVTPRGHLEIK